jgi:NAD(P)-dependent dehydrogenase (short-subunit alcohol dehydrogenase family)
MSINSNYLGGAFEGMTAVVTGGSNGIGAATAHHLQSGGARVIVLDIKESSDFESIQIDLRKTETFAAITSDLINRLKRVDILVNAAGISKPSELRALSTESYRETQLVNLEAPITLMKFIGSEMCLQRFGRIVNISSVHGNRSELHSLSYDTSKGGLEAATRTAALEYAQYGVLVNSVAPGFVDTQMSIVNGVNELETEWFQTAYIENQRLPLLRAADANEVAKLICWLSSHENSYITGQTITIDGGLSIGI